MLFQFLDYFWFFECKFLILLEYFSQHLGEYENVLSALEDLNVSILKAMDKTKKVRSSFIYCHVSDDYMGNILLVHLMNMFSLGVSLR